MKNESSKITSFTQLSAWQEGHKLALAVYRITKTFPDDEKFGLISQMRRAAVSVTSNIAEGFGRGSYQEKIRFYLMSQGSVTELQNQFLLSRDIGYINKPTFKELAEKSIAVHKITNGLIKGAKLKARNH